MVHSYVSSSYYNNNFCRKNIMLLITIVLKMMLEYMAETRGEWILFANTGVRLKRSIKSIKWFICSTSYLTYL